MRQNRILQPVKCAFSHDCHGCKIIEPGPVPRKGPFSCLSETTAQPVFFGPIWSDQSHPRHFQILSEKEKNSYLFFGRLPYQKAWVENKDSNEMADNLTQRGLGKEARPVRLNIAPLIVEQAIVQICLPKSFGFS